MSQPRRKTILILSQTFVPDPASVGQYMADVAAEMVRRGHRVRVYASRRSYEDASVEYPARENLRGVDVRRIGASSFGKKNIFLRVLGTASFIIQTFFLALFTPDLEGIFFSTSPPMVGVAATTVGLLRRVPTAYWAMDLNPDQLIAMQRISARSFTAKILESVNRYILGRAKLVITLDRFMAAALRKRRLSESKLLVMPPWPHEEHLKLNAECGMRNAEQDESLFRNRSNPFRTRHKLDGKFVLMYSGNHSPANPLETILQAAVAFKDDPNLRFVFIGGGQDKPKIERFVQIKELTNVLCLPYQPLEDLKFSLRAADVHLVSLGDSMVGVVHPCKIYGAMAISRPVLFLGPEPSHIADLMQETDIGWRIAQGDVDAAISTIRQILQSPREDLAAKGERAERLLSDRLGQARLLNILCDRLESVFQIKSNPKT